MGGVSTASIQEKTDSAVLVSDVPAPWSSPSQPQEATEECDRWGLRRTEGLITANLGKGPAGSGLPNLLGAEHR